jgi:hypothetical protein
MDIKETELLQQLFRENADLRKKVNHLQQEVTAQRFLLLVVSAITCSQNYNQNSLIDHLEEELRKVRQTPKEKPVSSVCLVVVFRWAYNLAQLADWSEEIWQGVLWVHH